MNDYDWLGHGIYFWEYGAQRAFEWAQQRKRSAPAVIGALIQLGNCFDLLDTRFTSDLKQAFPKFRAAMKSKGWALPANTGSRDKLARRLDCAVINWYLAEAERAGLSYQTVRCSFSEGDPIFRTSGMRMKNHIQISVRDRACVLGVFRPNGLN